MDQYRPPPSLQDLRGKIVILDFWTCMHMLAVLRELERKYSREVAVVGVHSAKFLAEKAAANLPIRNPEAADGAP